MEMLDRCPVCGGTDISLRYRGRPCRREWRDGRSFEVFGCAACGHGFLNPRLGFDELAPYYSSAYVAYDPDHGFADFERDVAEARRTGLLRFCRIVPGMRVLDVGCGGGAFLRAAAALGAEVQGVEPSAHGAETCRQAGVPVFHGTLDAFVAAGAPAPFDLVTCSHVLEHTPDPRAVLAGMAGLLAPGGRVWLAVPNAGCVFSRVLRDDWHSSDLPVHLHHFTARSMARAFEGSGLGVERIETASANSIPGSAAGILRKALVPQRLSRPVLGRLLASDRPLGRLLDRSGQGEALLVTATRAA